VSAQKGTQEYDEIFEKLKCISYAMGDDGKEDNKEGDEDDEIDEVDAIAESNASQEDSDTEI